MPGVSPVVCSGTYHIEKLYYSARGAFSYIVTHLETGKQSCVDERSLGRFTNYYSNHCYGQLSANGDVYIQPGAPEAIAVVIAFVKNEEARRVAESRDGNRPDFSEAFPHLRRAWRNALGEMFGAAAAAGLDTKDSASMREAIRISLGVGIQSRKQLTIQELRLATGAFAAGEWLPGWIHCPDALLS